MDFSLNDDQKLLQDSVSKFVKGSYDFEKRRNIVKQKNSFDPAVWSQFAELGWLMLPFSEEDDGLGGNLTDTMVLLEEFGKGLIVEPYIASIVTGGGFLKRADTNQKGKYLSRLVAGELQVAFAVQEYEHVFDMTQTQMIATVENDQLALNGCKSVVLNGDRADLLVVLARTQGQAGDRDGLTLLLVDANASGISRKAHRLVDGSQAAEIHFNHVKVDRSAILGELHKGADIADAVVAETILALGAEATGALSVLLYSTVEYTKTRKQFGVAIGSFQALQHRMTNMFMAYEQVRSLLLCATLKVHEGHEDAYKAVHALKANIGRLGRLIAQESVQLHGGMGMTDELHIGHYFKRITAIDALFGNFDHHIRAYAA